MICPCCRLSRKSRAVNSIGTTTGADTNASRSAERGQKVSDRPSGTKQRTSSFRLPRRRGRWPAARRPGWRRSRSAIRVKQRRDQKKERWPGVVGVVVRDRRPPGQPRRESGSSCSRADRPATATAPLLPARSGEPAHRSWRSPRAWPLGSPGAARVPRNREAGADHDANARLGERTCQRRTRSFSIENFLAGPHEGVPRRCDRAVGSAVLYLLAVVAASRHAPAQGGPPLETDDPVTLERGHWEINTAIGIDPERQRHRV